MRYALTDTEWDTIQSLLYHDRNHVERFFNRIKHCRRIATGYEKLAANYLAFIKLASIRLWFRADESTSWSIFGQVWPGVRAGPTCFWLIRS